MGTSADYARGYADGLAGRNFSTIESASYEEGYTDGKAAATHTAGIPAGGAQGTVLSKASPTDFDLEWAAGGGAAVPVLGFATNSNNPPQIADGPQTLLNLDTANFDPYGFCVDIGGGELQWTVPEGQTGTYLYVAKFIWGANADGFRDVRVIPDTIHEGMRVKGPASPTGQTIQVLSGMYLDARFEDGDQLTFSGEQDSGSPLYLEVQFSWFRLGDVVVGA